MHFWPTANMGAARTVRISGSIYLNFPYFDKHLDTSHFVHTEKKCFCILKGWSQHWKSYRGGRNDFVNISRIFSVYFPLHK